MARKQFVHRQNTGGQGRQHAGKDYLHESICPSCWDGGTLVSATCALHHIILVCVGIVLHVPSFFTFVFLPDVTRLSPYLNYSHQLRNSCAAPAPPSYDTRTRTNGNALLPVFYFAATPACPRRAKKLKRFVCPTIACVAIEKPQLRGLVVSLYCMPASFCEDHLPIHAELVGACER